MFLRDLISSLGGESIGEVQQPLDGVGTIEASGITKITFLANPKYRSALSRTSAGAVIVGVNDRDITSLPRIITANPYAYFARVAQLFHPITPRAGGIHGSAVIHPGATIAASASIAEFVSIGANATIGERVQIGAGAVIGDGVTIGTDSVIAPRVTIYPRCRIGLRGIIHAGVVIGADGFGFAADFQGEKGSWVKIPQSGRVIVGDDCEIGANTTIDRGAIEDTIIGNGVKLDNHIQVGHNCVIGDDTIISGCVGIAGSTTIGRRVMIGGGAGFTGHMQVCDGAVVSAMTLVSKSITVPGTVTGVIPQMRHEDWLKNIAHLRQLDKLAKEIKEIKNKGEIIVTSVMEIAEIKEYLPHRYPFLLVDRVLELESDKRIVAIKNVTINEPFFQGHFPHYPVMPGVLILEAMAQAAALLSFKSMGSKRDENMVVYLVGVDGARFKRPVVPGDTLILEAEKLLEKRGLVKYAVRAKVEDKVACEAEMLCTQRTIDKP